jgi:peroxiredoxin
MTPRKSKSEERKEKDGTTTSRPRAGAKAPDFEAPTDAGTTLRLSSLRGKPVVLYFYPKDATPG